MTNYSKDNKPMGEPVERFAEGSLAHKWIACGDNRRVYRWSTQTGQWYVFREHWRACRGEERRAVQEFLRAEIKDFVAGKGNKNKLTKRERQRVYRAPTVSAILSWLKTDDLHTDITEFDANPHLIGLPGGKVYDLRNGGYCREALPEDNISRTVKYLPIDYGDKTPDECRDLMPKWHLLLADLFQDYWQSREFQTWIQATLGYALTGFNAAEQMVFLTGKSGAGKSTLLLSLAEILGDYAVSLPGEAVTITVSTGPGQIFVPDVRGQSLIQAIQTLADQGFRVAERREPSATVPEGQIIDTDPPNGFPVALGLEVYIIVSDGPPLVAIPDVQGLLFDTGKLAIERAGLVIGIVTFEPVEPGSSDVGRILAQTPPPNLEVSAETPVDVVVGESSETEGDQIGPEPPEGEGGETDGIDQTGAGPPEEPDETG